MRIKLSENRIREIIRDEMMKKQSLLEQSASDEVDVEALAAEMDDMVLEMMSSLQPDVDRVIDLLDFPTSIKDLRDTNAILIDVVEQHDGLGLGVFNALYGMKESDIPLSENKNRLDEVALAAVAGVIGSAISTIAGGIGAAASAIGAGGAAIIAGVGLSLAATKELYSYISGLTKNVFENMEDRGMRNGISSTKFISSMDSIQGDKLKNKMVGALDKLFSSLSAGKAPPTKELLLAILGGDDTESIEANDEQVKEIQRIFSISPTGVFTTVEANKVTELLNSHWVLHADWRAEGEPGRDVSASDIYNEIVSFSQGEEPDGSLDNAAESMGVSGKKYMEKLTAFLKELNGKPEPEAPEPEAPEPVIQESRRLKISRKNLLKIINRVIISEVDSNGSLREAFGDLSDATPPSDSEAPVEDVEDEEDIEEDEESSQGGSVASAVKRIEQIIGHPNPDGVWDAGVNKSFFDFVKVRGNALEKDFRGVINVGWKGPGSAAASKEMNASYSGNPTGMIKFLNDIKGSGGGTRSPADPDIQVEYKAEIVGGNAPLTAEERSMLQEVLDGPGMFDGEGTIVMKFPNRNHPLDRKVNSWEIKDPQRALANRAKRALVPVMNAIWKGRPWSLTRKEGKRKELRGTYIQVNVVPK